MGGFHPLDFFVIVGIALLIFGPKTVQSIARSTGRGVHRAREAKEKVLSEFPVEDFAQMSKIVSHIPLSPQQAARKLISSALAPVEKRDEKKAPASQE